MAGFVILKKGILGEKRMLWYLKYRKIQKVKEF